MAHGGRARGEMGGEVHWFPLLGSLKNPTTGLIWLVTRVGGWGEAWGGGPWRAGKGADGGAPESSVGATKGWFPFFCAPLKTQQLGLGRRRGGGWPREEMGGTRKLVTVAGGGGG